VAKDGDIIRVLIADDHPVMRSGLRAVIQEQPDMRLVGEAADGAECIAEFGVLLPDVALLDLQMPKVDGLQAIGAIRSKYPQASIVVLTTYPGDARVTQALTLGAMSYLLKNASVKEIVTAIRRASDGIQTIAPEVAREIAAHKGSVPLTIRELSVLRMVAQGKSNKEISETLYVTEDAIKARMRSILTKLDASDRAHAVTIAMSRGFLD
jgi:DNA-binding NarL/FixJ family response regulator